VELFTIGGIAVLGLFAIAVIAVADAFKLEVDVLLALNSVISDEFDAISLKILVHFVPLADANADP